MVNPLAHWNDILTVLGFSVAAATGYFQIKHYLAQSARLSILDITEARYKSITKRNDSDELHPVSTRYEVQLRVENDGRESITVSGATLQLADTGEELDLARYEGSTRVRISGDHPPNLPSPSDAKMRVPGNDVVELQFRAEGNAREDDEGVAEGRVRLRTVGGDTCSQKVTLHP